MNSKGFTLIELLAVIVILAIIALIATPIVLNIINNTKNSAALISAEYYVNAVELGVARARLNNKKVLDGEYDILSNGNICLEVEQCITVDIKEDAPDRGKIKIENGKIVNEFFKYGENIITKDDNEFIIVPKPVSFKDDEWLTVIANVKVGNADVYKDNVGQNKTITLTSDVEGVSGTYTVRLANTSNTGDVCTKEYIEGTENKYSKTACGFVIEFVDIITTHVMNETATSVDGWPASKMYLYVNEIIYNALEDVIRDAIIPTTVVSGHESGTNKKNYISTDKLYLLSSKEVFGEAKAVDEVDEETRQLDYYENNGVSSVTSSVVAKKNAEGEKYWWLRSAGSNGNFYFCSAFSKGSTIGHSADELNGVAPALRLG